MAVAIGFTTLFSPIIVAFLVLALTNRVPQEVVSTILSVRDWRRLSALVERDAMLATTLVDEVERRLVDSVKAITLTVGLRADASVAVWDALACLESSRQFIDGMPGAEDVHRFGRALRHLASGGSLQISHDNDLAEIVRLHHDGRCSERLRIASLALHGVLLLHNKKPFDATMSPHSLPAEELLFITAKSLATANSTFDYPLIHTGLAQCLINRSMAAAQQGDMRLAVELRIQAREEIEHAVQVDSSSAGLYKYCNNSVYHDCVVLHWLNRKQIDEATMLRANGRSSTTQLLESMESRIAHALLVKSNSKAILETRAEYECQRFLWEQRLGSPRPERRLDSAVSSLVEAAHHGLYSRLDTHREKVERIRRNPLLAPLVERELLAEVEEAFKTGSTVLPLH